MPYFANPKNLYRGYLSTASAVLYTAPAPVTFGVQPKCVIKELVICNTDTAERTYNIDTVAYNGSVSGATKLCSAVTIAASTMHRILLSCVLEAGETLRGHADSASKVTITVSGIELT